MSDTMDPNTPAVAGGSLLDQVTHLADAITKVKNALDAIDPGRSVIFTVLNKTDQPMVFANASFDHGDWGIPAPAVIPPGTAGVFGAKSDGFATGTEGHIFYSIGGVQFDLYFDDPFFGGNSGNLGVKGADPLDFPTYAGFGAGNTDANYVYQIYSQPAPFGAMFVNVNSLKVLDVPGFSQQEGAQVQQYDQNMGPNQRWIMTKVGMSAPDGGDPVYTLRNQSSGLFLDVRGLSLDDHGIIQQYHGDGGFNQQWRFQRAPQDDGSYLIVSVNSGKCLDIPNSSHNDGVFVQQYGVNDGSNQRWWVRFNPGTTTT